MEQIVYERSKYFTENGSSFCPGCGHGIAHRLMIDTLEELGLIENAIVIYPVGCGTNGMFYTLTNNLHAPHGRAPAVATGVKRCAEDKTVVLYQGDGDLAAIGMAECIHGANRGDNVSTIFINNTIYGMTNGQYAPTTLYGQITKTTPEGRGMHGEGYPIDMCKLMCSLVETKFVARCALNTPVHIFEAQKCIRKALEMQRDKKGYAFVELLSMCPSTWKMDPIKAAKHIDDVVVNTFPLGIFKDEEVK